MGKCCNKGNLVKPVILKPGQSYYDQFDGLSMQQLIKAGKRIYCVVCDVYHNQVEALECTERFRKVKEKK